MRLIDADALVEKIESEIYCYWNFDGGGYYLAEDAVKEVEAAPTVDAEPVWHGKWSPYSSTMMECSVCKRHTARHKYEYCPRCGAKMDGD